MKNLSQGMLDQLSAESAKLCFCWSILRNDGVRLGFTDHDADLNTTFGLFESAPGIEATKISQSLGLSVDNLSLTGSISSDKLTEQDLENGLYFDADVELFLVDWSNTANYLLVTRGNIGEIKRGEHTFTAEFRSLAHRMNQKVGRTYQRYCDAHLGDARCGVALAGTTYRVQGALAEAQGRKLVIAQAATYKNGWFDRGLLTVLSGSSTGAKLEIKEHNSAFIGLWDQPPQPLLKGDKVQLQAGCDKSYKTCKERFNNGINFRGFPFIPGNDVMVWVASPGKDVYEGGSLFQ